MRNAERRILAVVRFVGRLNLHHIAAGQNPVPPHRRQSLFDVAVEIGISPGAGTIIDPDRRVGFDACTGMLPGKRAKFPSPALPGAGSTGLPGSRTALSAFTPGLPGDWLAPL